MEKTVLSYISFGGCFIVEIVATPYYFMEDAYYRAQHKHKKWCKPPMLY